MAIAVSQIARGVIVFEAKDDATNVARRVGGEFDKTSRQMEVLGKKSDGFFSNLTRGLGSFINPATLALGAITGLAGGLTLAVKAADEEAAGMARLNIALQNSIPGWDGNTVAVEKYIEKQQALAFSDDALRESLAFLVGQTKDLTEAQELQATAMDLARAKKITLEQATKALAKIDNDSLLVLRKLGIQVEENMTKEQALAAIRQQTAGQAEAFANTIGGSVERMQTAWGNAVETIGGVLLPRLTEAFQGVADFVSSPEFQEGFEKAVDVIGTGLSAAVDLAVTAFNTFGPVVMGVATFVKDNFTVVVTAAAVAITAQMIPALVTLTTVTLPAAIIQVKLFIASWGPIGLLAVTVGWGLDQLRQKFSALGVDIDLASKDGFLYSKKMKEGIDAGIPPIAGSIDTLVANMNVANEARGIGFVSGMKFPEGMKAGIDANAHDPIRGSYALATSLDNSQTAYNAGWNTGASFVNGMNAAISRMRPVVPGGTAFQNYNPERGTTPFANYDASAINNFIATQGKERDLALRSLGGGGGGGSGGGGGGGGGTAGKATEVLNDAKKQAEDATNAALDLAQRTSSAITAGTAALQSLVDFKKPSDEAMQSFVDAVDFISDKFRSSMVKWDAASVEFAGQFGEGVGKLLGGVGQGVDTLTKLKDFKKPSDEAMQSFTDAIDFLSDKLRVVMVKWNKDGLELAALFGDGVGKLIGGIGSAIEPLIKLGDFKKPTDEAMQSFSDAVDFLSDALRRIAVKWNKDALEVSVAFGEGVGKLLQGIGHAIKPLMDLREFQAPTQEVVTVFFDSLQNFITEFDRRATDFSSKASPIVAELAANIGKITKSIGEAIDPLIKMKEAQKITPEQIEGTMANLWLALHHFNEVMKSGELQGDWGNKAVAFAGEVAKAFGAIKASIDLLTDKSNPEGIVGAWKKGLDDIFYHTHSVWAPQLKDKFQFWFDQYTTLFQDYTANWVAIWQAAMGQLTPPAAPPGGISPTAPSGFNPPFTPTGQAGPMGANGGGGTQGVYTHCIFIDGNLIGQVSAATHAELVALGNHKARRNPGSVK